MVSDYSSFVGDIKEFEEHNLLLISAGIFKFEIEYSTTIFRF